MKRLTFLTYIFIAAFTAIYSANTAGLSLNKPVPGRGVLPIPRAYIVQKVDRYFVDCIDKLKLEPDGRRLLIEGSLLTVKDEDSNEIAEVYVPPNFKAAIGDRFKRVRLRIAKQFYYGTDCSPGADPKALNIRSLEHPDRLRKNTDYFLTDDEIKNWK